MLVFASGWRGGQTALTVHPAFTRAIASRAGENEKQVETTRKVGFTLMGSSISPLGPHITRLHVKSRHRQGIVASRFSERHLPYGLRQDLELSSSAFNTAVNATKASSERQRPTLQWLCFEITPLDRTGECKSGCLPMMAIHRRKTEIFVVQSADGTSRSRR